MIEIKKIMVMKNAQEYLWKKRLLNFKSDQ